ncbi:MAG: hypothetical protein GF330_14180 [Candidatus Eisenbacteria bacterium]|nr:hypothetical protein [Candidatus Eisenbacteria bacterium]
MPAHLCLCPATRIRGCRMQAYGTRETGGASDSDAGMDPAAKRPVVVLYNGPVVRPERIERETSAALRSEGGRRRDGMRRDALLGAILAISTVWTIGDSSATTRVYTEETGWQNAAGGSYLTEDFADTLLNPGVSFVSTESGHINPQHECYQYVLPSQSQNEPMTTWTFEPQIVAYRGDWTPGGPGGSGNSLWVFIADDSLYVGSIPNSHDGEFWGFVSDAPFSSVRLVGGPGTHQEHYCLDDMVYASDAGTGDVESLGPFPATRRLVLRVPSPYGVGQTIRVTGHRAAEASVGIFDAQGRLLRSLAATRRHEGEVDFRWDGSTADGQMAPASALFVRAQGG